MPTLFQESVAVQFRARAYILAVEWLYHTGIEVTVLPDGREIFYNMSTSHLEELTGFFRLLGILKPPVGMFPAGDLGNFVNSDIVEDVEGAKRKVTQMLQEGSAPPFEQMLVSVVSMAQHLFVSVGEGEGIEFDTYSQENPHAPIFTRLEVLGYCFKEEGDYIWTDQMMPIIEASYNGGWPAS
jgi:hypothetical protein